ncbi:MAG: hypothetical protein Q4A16_10720 [Lautropia sp.]|nr:hypothetical protein [Lautropia sp.]
MHDRKSQLAQLSMLLARDRILRTSRLFLLPAFAVSLAAGTGQAMAVSGTTAVRQGGDAMRGTVVAQAQYADGRHSDDERDHDRDSNRDDEHADRDSGGAWWSSEQNEDRDHRDEDRDDHDRAGRRGDDDLAYDRDRD